MKEYLKQFGGRATREELDGYTGSDNWDGDKFINREETSLSFDLHKLPEFFRKQMCEKEDREPNTPLPIEPLERALFLEQSNRVKLVWYGHAAFLWRMSGKTILVDPMLGPNAAPISPMAIKRFSDNTLDLIDDFPEIDALMLTHDHYDHLDMGSILRLIPKVKSYHVALGVKRHLVSWGVDASIITEYDWWEDNMLDDIRITFTPTRHFSGRGLKDRAKSLWGGWVFTTPTENIYFSGDGGYGTHFKEVGERLGPFDLGIMECGQYNDNWHQIHMNPEEAIQAAIDARVEVAVPFHWAGFALAQHTWYDPADRFFAEAEKRGVRHFSPRLGEIVGDYTQYAPTKWWEAYL